MKLDNKLKRQLDETKYLSTDNTWCYRAIIRLMYQSYEKMKYWFYREDIFEKLNNDFRELNQNYQGYVSRFTFPYGLQVFLAVYNNRIKTRVQYKNNNLRENKTVK